MPVLSKNVARSMRTDINNKRSKAQYHKEEAEKFDAEAGALEKFLTENKEPEGSDAGTEHINRK